MANSGQTDADLFDLVTASLIRWGSDTLAARHFKDLKLALPGQDRTRALGEELEPQTGRRAQMMSAARTRAAGALAEAGRTAIHPVAAGRENYPDLLTHLPDPPIVLWTAGIAATLALPAVALVGSRRATPAGLACANRLGRELARAGLVVVSGMARGIDAAAHRGALESGGRTVAVLGCGLDVVYPREHRDLADSIRSTGCLVSEFPPGTPPLPRHFPLRNRLISGVSLGVVVVEAAERSGSLITARMALEQGRDVMAVPGGVVSGCHRGCHALIKDGAHLVETAADVLTVLKWQTAAAALPTGPSAAVIGGMLPGEAVGLDELVERMSRPAAAVLAELGQLEVAGQVARMPGGLFVRLD